MSAPSKSALIRSVITENPEATTEQIIALCRKQGVKVLPNLIYGVKASMPPATTTPAKGAGPLIGGRTPSTGNLISLGLVAETRTLAAKAGGMANLKQLVDVLV